jgi:hypothetical protein
MSDEPGNKHRGAGIHAGPGSIVTIEGCEVYDNGGPGVLLEGAHSVHMKDLVAHGNQGGGVVVKVDADSPPPTAPEPKSWWSAVRFDVSVKLVAAIIVGLVLAVASVLWDRL